MTIFTKSGVSIIVTGAENTAHITTSDGKQYTYTGRVLLGPIGILSYNVNSVCEAVGIVIGMYGGRKF